MLDARVIGFGHSTVKHPSMKGVRLALCEGLRASGEGDGKVFLAADWHGAGVGQRVFVTTDGEAATRSLRGSPLAEKTPVRNVILGICDGESAIVDAPGAGIAEPSSTSRTSSERKVRGGASGSKSSSPGTKSTSR